VADPAGALHVADSGAVAAGGDVAIIGTFAAGRDVRVEHVTVIADDGPPVGDQAARPGGISDRCPYPGLSAFGATDADLFFGRDADRDAVLRLVAGNGLVALVGSSGSGKSSLLAAAVAPAAAGGPGPFLRWHPVLLRPGPDPLVSLAAARAGRDRYADDTPVLWLIDQFEEAFDPAVDDAVRAAFLDVVVELAAAPSGDHVVIALRSDFYVSLDANPALARAAAAAQHRLVPLDPDVIADVVVGPAERVGLRVEPALTTTLRREVAANPNSVPLLGYALRQTWRRRRNGWLTLAEYVDAGGIAGALTQGAHRTWSGLSPALQQAAKRLLLRLSYVGTDGIGVRRRRACADLVTDVDDRTTVTEVINKLAIGRLLLVSVDPVQGAVVEIAHESLLREWPLLRDWLTEDRDTSRVREELASAVELWDRNDRHSSYLLPALRVQTVESLARQQRLTLTSTERRFILDSRRRSRRQRALRRTLPALSLLVAVLTAVTALAVVSQRRAEHSRQVANALQVAAAARSALTANRDLSALLGVAAYDADPDDTTLGTLMDTVAAADGPSAFLHPAPFADSLSPSLLPDGSAVVGLSDGHVQISPRLSPGRSTVLGGHEDAVSKVLVLDDLVVSADVSGVVLVHRIGQAGPLLRLTAPGAGGPVTAITGDGQRHLVIVATGHTLRRYPLDDPLHPLPPLTAPDEVTSLAADPASGELVAATQSGAVLRWRTATGAALPSLTGRSDPLGPEQPPRLALDADGTLAAVDGTTLTVWSSLRTRPSPVRTATPAPGSAAVSWQPLTGQLLVGATDGTITAWVAGAKPIQVGQKYSGLMPANRPGTPGAALATDGSDLVALDATGTLVRWSLGAARAPAATRVTSSTNSQRAVAWSTSGTLASATADGSIALVDGGGAPRRAGSVPAPVGGMVWRSPTELVVGAGDGALYSLNVSPTFRPRRLTAPTGSPIIGISRGRHGEIASLTSSGVLQILSPSNVTTRRQQLPTDGHAVALGGDDLVATATGDGPTIVITMQREDGTGVRTLRGHRLQVDSLAFSPNGKTLASGSDDQSIRLWSTDSGAALGQLLGHTDMVQALAFSADGRMLASGSQDGTLRLWSVPTRTELGRPLVDAPGFVPSLAVEPSGNRIAATHGTAVTLWPFTPQGWIATACRLADRELTPAEWTQDAAGLTPHRLCGR
jgi:WD40 repeat protein